MIMVNTNWMVRGMFNFVWPVFDGYTRQKILMTGDCDSKDYLTNIVPLYFDVNKLEKKYGGKM